MKRCIIWHLIPILGVVRENMYRLEQPFRIIQGAWLQRDHVRLITEFVMYARPAIRAERTGDDPIIAGPDEAIQLTLDQFKLIGGKAHGQTKGAARLSLAMRAMAGDQRRGFAGYSVAHGSALATAFVGLRH